jgi:hypothetical protein
MKTTIVVWDQTPYSLVVNAILREWFPTEKQLLPMPTHKKVSTKSSMDCPIPDQ